jgi:hypothetical protein
MRILAAAFLFQYFIYAQSPRSIAEAELRTIAQAEGLSNEDISAAYISREYTSAHNGVSHFVFRQRFEEIDVHNAVFTVNVGPDGKVLNSGGTLVKGPSSQVAAPAVESGMTAIRAAVRAVRPGAVSSYLPGAKSGKLTRFVRGGVGEEIEGKPIWFSVDGNLRPAWLFYISGENGADRYVTIVDTEKNRVLQKYNLTRYQTAAPRGLVFERSSPQPNPRPGTIVADRPYVQRTLQPFTGDPKASPRGWVDGTETVGNNVVAGHNPLGLFQTTRPVPAVAPDRNFSFPLELGPGAPNPSNYKDAATTNLFYWANKAHDLFYLAGFDEAAGNFQQDNFGRGGVGGDPMYAYSQFGIAADSLAELDNAFFTTNRSFEDGARVSINMFLSGNRDVFTDGSFDAEAIVHEYAHGVSNRLVQGVNQSPQGGAMGEGWSDFFGLEFTVPRGAPADGTYAVAEYLFQRFGLGLRSRTYSTDLSVNPLTFGSLGRVGPIGPEVHDDGEIWASALWEARAALVKQFGEEEGRRRIRLLVIDGMKLSPPSPSMVDARDAILLADRVTFKGESQAQLWVAFAKRGLGVTAFSNSAFTSNVTPSSDVPSESGVIRFQNENYTMGEQVRVILHDANNTSSSVAVHVTTSSGDLENIVLRKRGETYQGFINSFNDGFVARYDSALDLVPADYISVYYLDADAGGKSSKLIQTTVGPVQSPYYTTMQSSARHVVSGVERPLYEIEGDERVVLYRSTVVLPFAFPYFDRTYRTVFVTGDGILSFDPLLLASCNDRSSAARATVIAPMWMELAYNGRGQATENVFYSSGPDSVTFRWAAETIQTGDPVNFSVVLYNDGRILFQYGDGNVNLVNSPVFGCTTQAPFVGLSNGRESYVFAYDAYTGSPLLERAPSVLFQPPFGHSSEPVVRLETPEPGGQYQGVLTVKGIAYDPDSNIARLDILIDGVPRRLIVPNQSRTDFCAAERVRGCPLVGFLTSIDFVSLGIPAGTHTLQIRATNARGAFKNFPEQPVTFTVAPGQSREPAGTIEAPAAGAAVTGSTPIRGYAYAPDLRILAVDILIDGLTYGRATYGQRRDEVCRDLPNRPPNCPNVGFSFTLDSAGGEVRLPNGRHSLQARVLDEAGRYTLLPATPITINVENAANLPPTGVLATPGANARLSGTVKIWGYAWDLDGTVETVQLLIDGVIYGNPKYGDERAQQCATLPDVKACPNIGFDFDFDTTQVSNGLHQLGIRIVDDKGRAAIVPGSAAFGINVFIQN